MIKLLPHQVEASKYLVENKGGCLWMEMRTGKTYPTIDALKRLGRWPALIVCPKPVMSVWRDAFIAMGADPVCIQMIEGTMPERRKRLKDPYALNILNYEGVVPTDAFRKADWGAIVLDESTRIANFDTKISTYCSDYAGARKPQVPVRICLSGSPAAEGMVKLITQWFFALNSVFGYGDPEKYLLTYWRYLDKAYKWLPKKRAHLTDLDRWNKSKCFCRTMAELGLGSEKLYRMAYVPMPAEIRSRIDAYANDPEITSLVAAGKELQLCAGLHYFDGEKPDIWFDKIDRICELHEEDKQPFIVFTNLTRGMSAWNDRFKAAGFRCAFLKGGSDNIDETIAKFQAGGLDCLILQVVKFSMGVDLSRAKTIYYVNNHMGLTHRIQSEMRATNVGKTDPVEIVDVIFEGSIEEDVITLLKNKKEVSDAVIDRMYQEKRRSK